jgi:hypothetical protein
MSQLFNALPVPSAAAVAAREVVYGATSDHPQSLLYDSTNQRVITTGALLASVDALVSPWPVVRWPDRAIIIARPVIKAVRFVGNIYPREENKVGRSLAQVYWRPGYMAFMHIEAGSAEMWPAWSWPEQVVLVARSIALRSPTDVVLGDAAARELQESLVTANLLDDAQVLWDIVAKKPRKLIVGDRAIGAQLKVAKQRVVYVEKVIDKADADLDAGKLPAGSAGHEKYLADINVVNQWRDAAIAQRDYWQLLRDA